MLFAIVCVCGGFWQIRSHIELKSTNGYNNDSVSLLRGMLHLLDYCSIKDNFCLIIKAPFKYVCILVLKNRNTVLATYNIMQYSLL